MSMLSKIVEKITDFRKQRLDGYRALIVAVADEGPVKAEDAERVLANAGKTTQDLQADVARLLQRRQLRAQVDKDAGGRLDREIADLTAQIQAADEKLKAATIELENKHYTKVTPLEVRIGELRGHQRAASKARSQLAQGADPTLVAQLAEVNQKLVSLRAEQQRMRDRNEETKTHLRVLEAKRSAASADPAEQLDATIEKTRQQLCFPEKLDGEAAELEARAVQIQALMLEP